MITLLFAALAQAAAPDCVTIGKPQPSKVYVYSRRDFNDALNEFTNQWQEVSETGLRLRVKRGTEVIIYTNRHRIVDDVSVIDSSSQALANGSLIEKTTFRPGVIGDPAFKACAGRSWTIIAGTASHESTKTGTISVPTDRGSLRIMALRESVTVPAGRFDAVRYIRTMATPSGQTIDEYWKSIEHGVVVKQISTAPGGRSTMVLVRIQ
jgi:hypothetical protein